MNLLRNIRVHCYVCNTALVFRNMTRISGDENAGKQEIAISRRLNANREPLAIDEETRICNNCNISIVREIRDIENDPSCLQLNVLTQTSSHSCLVCRAENNLHRLSSKARIDIFVKRNVYVQSFSKSCEQHLDEKGCLIELLQENLRFVNRPYKIKGTELNVFLTALRNEVIEQRNRKFEDESDFSEEQFLAVSSITKNQFQDLFTFCDPVAINGTLRYLTKKDLTFLCKD